MLAEPDALAEAIRRRPALHRYVNTLPRWVLDACRRLVDEYDGDAGAIWGDRPTARELQARLDAFLGISQKKAAMTAMLLWRDRDVEIREMDGCDVAVDIHIRRVFLRSGLVERDDPRAMIATARELWPELPGALDPPAWAVGRNWCHASEPNCPICPLSYVCPKLIARAVTVIGP
jgi:endonuclease III